MQEGKLDLGVLPGALRVSSERQQVLGGGLDLATWFGKQNCFPSSGQ